MWNGLFSKPFTSIRFGMRKLFYIHILKVHRFVFDNLYVQNKLKYSFKEQFIIKYYNFLSNWHHHFRPILICWFALYDRAYKLKRLSFYHQWFYFKLLKINLKRYSKCEICEGRVRKPNFCTQKLWKANG